MVHVVMNVAVTILVATGVAATIHAVWEEHAAITLAVKGCAVIINAVTAGVAAAVLLAAWMGWPAAMVDAATSQKSAATVHAATFFKAVVTVLPAVMQHKHAVEANAVMPVENVATELVAPKAKSVVMMEHASCRAAWN